MADTQQNLVLQSHRLPESNQKRYQTILRNLPASDPTNLFDPLLYCSYDELVHPLRPSQSCHLQQPESVHMESMHVSLGEREQPVEGRSIILQMHHGISSGRTPTPITTCSGIHLIEHVCLYGC